MPHSRALRNWSRTSSKPRRPFERERLKQEMMLIGEFGLKNKREVWRVRLVLAKIRKSARVLLTLPEDDTRRIFEGDALLKRLHQYGILPETKNSLDHVLRLKIEDFMERRLQVQVVRKGIASTVHQSRVMIRGRHIRVGAQMVDVPSFMVRVESEKHIDRTLPKASGNPGRYARRQLARQGGADDMEDEYGY
eukprot:TRINITY_DN5_c0_g1_i1.p1 TRINITY_DN5_c0_g1~~TRINITY_DN5_c0_g1_i1.p1  ORF type:complete len:193 (+),score=55.62 TRINITY_DN5_c0_g1_i1:74-652(+)